jgi:V/A-type H+-transporting ATPase subunit A
VDSYCSSKKMNTMLKLILKLHHLSIDALSAGVPFDELTKIKVKEDIARSKYIPEDQFVQLEKIAKTAESEIEVLKKMYTQKEVVLGF